MFSAIDSLHDLKKPAWGFSNLSMLGAGAHPTAPDTGALPETGRWAPNSGTPTSPLASQSACLGAEEDLGVAERAVQNKGVSLSTKSTNFHKWGTASPDNFAFALIRGCLKKFAPRKHPAYE